MLNSQPNTMLIGQSGGATAVINSSLAGIVHAARQSGKWSRILGLANGIEGLFQQQFADLSDLDARSLKTLSATPSAALGTGRFKLKDDDLARAVLTMQTLGVTAFIYIGGNDSADTAHRIEQFARHIGYDLQVMSVPKTIDNDLPGTDFCPGYPSISKYLGNAVRDATYDTIASPQLHPVKFVEVMGRYAGWVAASATAGFSAEEQDLVPLILLPERKPKDTDTVLQAIASDIDRRGFSVVVVPETLESESGKHFGGDEPEYVDSFGHPYFASTGAALTRLVTQVLGQRARYEKPGTAARMSISMASDVDLEQAWKLGAAAVQIMLDGKSGLMTALQRTGDDPLSFEITTVPASSVANNERELPSEFIGADDMSVTPAFHDYLLPLLGENPFPPYYRLDAPGHIVGGEIPSVSGMGTPVLESESGDDVADIAEPEVGLNFTDGEDGEACDAHGDIVAIKVGQDVIGSCGHKIGEVVDVTEEHVVVEKGFFNPEDVYVPKTAIDHADEHQIVLTVSRDDSMHAGWEDDPDSENDES